MSVSLMSVLAELTIASSLAFLVVALTRKPMRGIAGARVAYWLWLLVSASTLVLALPAPSGLIVWAAGSALMLALMVCRQRVFIRSLGNLASDQDGTKLSIAAKSAP